MLRIRTTGAQWHLRPECYANGKTISRRFPQWCPREVLTPLANTLREEGGIDERERFIDASFAAAKVKRRQQGDDGFNLRDIVINHNHSRRDFLLVGNVPCMSHPFLKSELY
jgi:hypothetical protein